MTNTKKILIGKVYADWCGHCVSLKPEWLKMKNYIKKNFKHIDFIEAESSQKDIIENLKKKYNIIAEGYPTLFKIKENGVVEYYKGKRFAKELLEWATSKYNKSQRYMGGSTRSRIIKKSRNRNSRSNNHSKKNSRTRKTTS